MTLPQPGNASSDDRIAAHARLLSNQLLALREKFLPPESTSLLQTFTFPEKPLV